MMKGSITLLTAVVVIVILLAAPGVAAQSTDDWTLDNKTEWDTGSFNETDTWGGEIALTAEPTPNWNVTASGDGMMVDVNNNYNDTHMVYTVNGDAVYMANQTTGNVLWSSADGQNNYLDTAAIGPQFVYSGDDSNAYVHDHAGNLVHTPNSANCCKETIVPGPNGYFYLGNESSAIGVYDGSDGTAAYAHDLLAAVDGLDEDYVYAPPSSMYVDSSGDYLYVQSGAYDDTVGEYKPRVFVFGGIPSDLTLEASWPLANGGIDEYDTDSVYADSDYFYFSGDNGNVSVAEKGTWDYLGNISATGANVWSVDSDERHIYYAAHDGFVYVHKKSSSEGFPLVETVNVGEGSRANSVDGNNERVFYATDGGTVGALDKHTDGGDYTNTNDWGMEVKHNNVTVDASINSNVDLVLRSDTDDDGTFEDSTTVAVQDGNNTYNISELGSGYRTQFEFRMDLSSGDPSPVISFSRVGVSLPFFDVNITDTNSPVNETEMINVTANVTNTGALQDTQTLTLNDTFNENVVRDSEDVTLGPGNTTSITLEWQTQSGEGGTGPVTVASDDTTTTTTAVVEKLLDRRDVGRGQLDQARKSSRDLGRGERGERDDLRRDSGRNRNSNRRDRGRASR